MMKNIKLFENLDENEKLLLHVENGPFKFIYKVDDLEDEKVYGELHYKNKIFKGFFEYNEKSGLSWNLKTSSNEVFDGDETLVDEHPDEWVDFTNEIITLIQD